jgi:2'-5' RNA ligase
LAVNGQKKVILDAFASVHGQGQGLSDFYGNGSRTGEGVAPLILTAQMEPEAASHFDRLRKAYFPASRNFIPAHLTLFHALPGARIEEWEEELAERCWQAEPLQAHASGLRFMGNGVAIQIEAPALVSLHASLALNWRDVLTPQDRQRFNPHVTVQNKVKAAHARQTFDALQAVFEPFTFEIEGLELWHYRGGPWEAAGVFPFGGMPK